MDADNQADHGGVAKTVGRVLAVLLGIIAVVGIAVLLGLQQMLGGVMGSVGGIDPESVPAVIQEQLDHAKEVCEAIPTPAAEQIVAGIQPSLPGSTFDPTTRSFNYRLALESYRWPPTSHIVRVWIHGPDEREHFYLVLEGSINSPDSIEFLPTPGYPTNPTSFNRAEHSTWPYEATDFCGEVGPYVVDQSGNWVYRP